jgi:hypothetical protein
MARRSRSCRALTVVPRIKVVSKLPLSWKDLLDQVGRRQWRGLLATIVFFDRGVALICFFAIGADKPV